MRKIPGTKASMLDSDVGGCMNTKTQTVPLFVRPFYVYR